MKSSVSESLRNMFTGGDSSKSVNRETESSNKRKIIANGSSNVNSNESNDGSKEKDILQFTSNFAMSKSIARECGLHKFHQIVSWNANIIILTNLNL